MTSQLWYEFRNLVGSGNYAGAEKLLSSSKSLLDARNSIGETVLHHMAVESHLEAVKWLFTKGADLNSQNEFGNPPVFEVGMLGNQELLLWFVQNGADLSLRNCQGHDVWEHLAEFNCKKTIKYLRTICA